MHPAVPNPLVRSATALDDAPDTDSELVAGIPGVNACIGSGIKSIDQGSQYRSGSHDVYSGLTKDGVLDRRPDWVSGNLGEAVR
jgi:hypothetical protein